MMDAPAPLPETTTAADPPGALRGLFAALLEALHTRLELAGVELEIHLRALLRSLIWAVGAVACAMLALAFGMLALVAALWSSHRMLALLGGTLLFVLLAALFGYLGARALRIHPDVLEGSLEQLAKDERRARGEP
ncbi:MAG: phage holin family protein [Gammaproteobacteria bacterium]|nr:phage holin family protein [Gammaproteobacteria bacterium]